MPGPARGLRARLSAAGGWLRHRQPAQDVLEFSLIIAGVTLVGIAGLSVLGRGEEGYFIPLQSTLAPTAPVGTDDVVHPVDVTINCTPTTVVVGNQTTCAVTVRDAWNVKRLWPQGSIQLWADNAPAGGNTCSLAQDTSTGDTATSACTIAPSWSPAAGNVPSVSLGAQYIPSDATHQPSSRPPSARQTITVLPRLQFTPAPQCVNQVNAGMGNQVEVGEPLHCSVTVVDPSTGPASNVDVTWTIVGGSGSGSPLLSCATDGVASRFASTIWNTSGTNPCDPATSMHCITDASGQCSVIYRRIRNLYGGASSLGPGTQDLSLSVLSGAITVPLPDAVVVVDAVQPHTAQTFMTCTGSSMGHGHVDVSGPATFRVRSATFQSTPQVTVHSDMITATLSCMATIIDTDANTALDCSAGTPPSCTSGNPDIHTAHAPVGTIAWQWRGNLYSPCTLRRLDNLPPQAPNQTPYASQCSSDPLIVTGHDQEDADLTAVYTGSGSSPTHQNSLNVPVRIHFDDE